MEFSYDEDKFVQRAKEAGIDALLTLDLPPEEASGFIEVCDRHQMKNVFIIGPTTPPDRIKMIAEHTTGFLYYASLTGVTGERKQVASDLENKFAEIRQSTDRPVVVGFGVSKTEHVQKMAKVADGVVVGSALVKCIAEHIGDGKKIVNTLKAKVEELSAGVKMH